jgi:hypothetical protein
MRDGPHRRFDRLTWPPCSAAGERDRNLYPGPLPLLRAAAGAGGPDLRAEVTHAHEIGLGRTPVDTDAFERIKRTSRRACRIARKR